MAHGFTLLNASVQLLREFNRVKRINTDLLGEQIIRSSKSFFNERCSKFLRSILKILICRDLCGSVYDYPYLLIFSFAVYPIFFFGFLSFVIN